MCKIALAVVLSLCLAGGAAAASDIDGSWLFVFDTEAGERRAAATLKLEGERVSGKVDVSDKAGGDTDITGAYSASSGEVSLSFPYYSEDAGYKAEVQMTGKLKDGKITGNWKFDVYSGTFTGSRND